jgi:16S rRNA (guanine966-N2)-methyltransferase
MLRIVGGKFKRRVLLIPPAHVVRPTSDRAREAVFNILQSNLFGDIKGARVADIFAGTGAMGIEALSRGASYCCFVEKSPMALKILKSNLKTIDIENNTKIFNIDALSLRALQDPFDLVFLDPPYDVKLTSSYLKDLKDKNWLHEKTCVVYETSSKEIPMQMEEFEKVDERQYGAAGFSFWINEIKK